MPPTDLQRRMYAGGIVTIGSEALINVPLVQESSVSSIVDKQGRSGELRFVTVRHEVTCAGKVAITEEQKIVYSDRSGRLSQRGNGAHHQDWAWGIDVKLTPTLLFRFSALTYNAHRIHYDRDFATKVEGFGGLVVHGPLQALAMLELLRRNSRFSPRTVSFRLQRPMCDKGTMQVRGRQASESTIELATYDDEGQLAAKATVDLDSS